VKLNLKNLDRRTTTLDLDFTNKEWLRKRINFIINCPNFLRGFIRESASGNGYHIIFTCKIKCSICRTVFDSSRRQYYDMMRQPHHRNCLWDWKEYRKFDKKIKLKAGRWFNLEGFKLC